MRKLHVNNFVLAEGRLSFTLETSRLRFFGILGNREFQKVTLPGPCCQVCSLRFMFVGLDHAPEKSDLLQGFLHPKTSQSYI